MQNHHNESGGVITKDIVISIPEANERVAKHGTQVFEKDIGDDTPSTSKAKASSMLEDKEIDKLCNLMHERCFIDGLDKILGAHLPLDMKNPDENESGDGKDSLLLECFLGLPHSKGNMDDDDNDSDKKTGRDSQPISDRGK
jgi:hypothetical protein